MKYIDFSYPLGFIGYHSGWNNNGEPTKELSLTLRRKIKLKSYPSIILDRFDDKIEEVPFLIKNRKGKIEGLSCGAGGALVKLDGSVYKFKRNGFKYEGFTENYINDRELLFKKSSIIENSIYEHGGALDYNDALREINNHKLITKLGFVSPYKPIGIRKIGLPFKTEETYCSLIYEVKSDLRADEVCMAVLINILSKIKNKAKFDQGYIYLTNVNTKDIITQNEEEFDLLHNLGRKIGRIYKRLHKKNLIRGIGNSWYGNEIIMPDGEVGVTDLDSMYTLEQFRGNEEVFIKFQKNDLNLFTTGVYSSLSYFENCVFDFAAQSIIEGFNKGYFENKKINLNPKKIIEQIDCFRKNRRIIKNEFKQILF